MLKGKCVVLGVTGSIAAYKAASLASLLIKQHCCVNVIMTKNAQQFITAVTFETLTGTRCITDTFDRNFAFEVEHVSLAKKADIIVIAPATANIIGKINYGIGDDMLTTTVLAKQCPVVLSPAMNTNMYNNEIVRKNIEELKSRGFEFISPDSGRLACGDVGKGKMAEPEKILEYIIMKLSHKKDLEGKKVLITAGATTESIDPVRFITNHSSGKMGFALAKAALSRGAEVTVVYGNVTESLPQFCNCVNIKSAEEMYNKVTEIAPQYDYIFKAAAVADYTPIETANEKIKKKDGEMCIQLKRTKDILKTLGENKRENQIICGFSMETENMLENSKKKLVSKNVDMIAANNLKQDGAGFGTDTNIVTLITKDGVEVLPVMSKIDVAHKIIDKAVEIAKN
jgi:phosphopantothenoylcysteine decarboxylase/phosphopantothenate--cysteine ligase